MPTNKRRKKEFEKQLKNETAKCMKINSFFSSISTTQANSCETISAVESTTAENVDNGTPEVEFNQEEDLQPRRSKHKTGFDPTWTVTFPWLKNSSVDEREVLFCTLCSKHHSKSITYKKSPWITGGCLTVRLDKVKAHEHSEMHCMSVAAEFNSEKSKNGEIEISSEMFQAVEYAMKCLNFLIQHNLPVTNLFGPFIDFCIDELQSPVLCPLRKAKNACYTSCQTVAEFLNAMASVRKEDLLEDINNSPCFSVLTDETTDVNKRSHMAVAVKYLKDGESKLAFVNDCQLPDGKAETIMSQLKPTVEECGGFKKMSGFVSDGANVMVGIHAGVATKVKQENDKVITVNCLNHKLALASKDSFESLTRYITVDETMTSVYKYYKYSACRTNSFVNAQNLFGKGKGTTLKRVGLTRWLSHHEAVNSIRINYKAILTDLENATATGERCGLSGPTAAGLLKIFKSYEFFQAIHFLCDVLAVTTKLNLTLQKSDVDLSFIEPLVSSALTDLERLKKKPGGLYCRHLPTQARKVGICAPIEESDGPLANDSRAFINHLIENISSRLSSQPVLSNLGVLDLRKVGSEDNLISLYGNNEITELAEYFDLDEDKLLSEWDDYKYMFLKRTNIDSSDLSIKKLCSLISKSENTVGQTFPLLQHLLSVACSLPISNAEIERVFSQVKLILTDKRNRLKVDTVNQLLMLKLNTEVDFVKAVRKWKNYKSRRIFL